MSPVQLLGTVSVIVGLIVGYYSILYYQNELKKSKSTAGIKRLDIVYEFRPLISPNRFDSDELLKYIQINVLKKAIRYDCVYCVNIRVENSSSNNIALEDFNGDDLALSFGQDIIHLVYEVSMLPRPKLIELPVGYVPSGAHVVVPADQHHWNMKPRELKPRKNVETSFLLEINAPGAGQPKPPTVTSSFPTLATRVISRTEQSLNTAQLFALEKSRLIIAAWIVYVGCLLMLASAVLITLLPAYTWLVVPGVGGFLLAGIGAAALLLWAQTRPLT